MERRIVGAVERIRTFTVLLPPAPQAGASASSATTARRCENHSSWGRRSPQAQRSLHSTVDSPKLETKKIYFSHFTSTCVTSRKYPANLAIHAGGASPAPTKCYESRIFGGYFWDATETRSTALQNRKKRASRAKARPNVTRNQIYGFFGGDEAGCELAGGWGAGCEVAGDCGAGCWAAGCWPAGGSAGG
jgi:hypothetical protein